MEYSKCIDLLKNGIGYSKFRLKASQARKIVLLPSFNIKTQDGSYHTTKKQLALSALLSLL